MKNLFRDIRLFLGSVFYLLKRYVIVNSYRVYDTVKRKKAKTGHLFDSLGK